MVGHRAPCGSDNVRIGRLNDVVLCFVSAICWWWTMAAMDGIDSASAGRQEGSNGGVDVQVSATAAALSLRITCGRLSLCAFACGGRLGGWSPVRLRSRAAADQEAAPPEKSGSRLRRIQRLANQLWCLGEMFGPSASGARLICLGICGMPQL